MRFHVRLNLIVEQKASCNEIVPNVFFLRVDQEGVRGVALALPLKHGFPWAEIAT